MYCNKDSCVCVCVCVCVRESERERESGERERERGEGERESLLINCSHPGPSRDEGSSHSDGELWPNFIVQTKLHAIAFLESAV